MKGATETGMKKTAFMIFVTAVVLIVLGAFISASAAPAVYTLPAHVSFPTFAECAELTGWTDTSYSYMYEIPNRKANDPLRFEIIPQTDDLALYYPNLADGPYGENATFFALTNNGNEYTQLSVSRMYPNFNNQISWAVIQNDYTDHGDLYSVSIGADLIIDDNTSEYYRAFYQPDSDEWTYQDSSSAVIENPDEDLLSAFAPLRNFINDDSISVQYAGSMNIRDYLTAESSGSVMTFNMPASIEYPSREECEAFTGWDYMNVSDGSSASFSLYRDNLPYSIDVEFDSRGEESVYLRQYIAGTAADPVSGIDPIPDTNICFWYPASGGTYVWTESNYSPEENLFESLYISMSYNQQTSRASSGSAWFTINSNSIHVNYSNGQWLLTDEVMSSLGTGQVQADRISYLTSYELKPVTVNKSGVLSIRDYLVPDTKPILSIATDASSYDYADVVTVTANIMYRDGTTDGLDELYPDAHIWATLMTADGEAVSSYIVQQTPGLTAEFHFPLGNDELEPGDYKVYVETNVEDLSAYTVNFRYTADKSKLPDPSACQVSLSLNTDSFGYYETLRMTATVTDEAGQPAKGIRVGFMVLNEDWTTSNFFGEEYDWIYNITRESGQCSIAFPAWKGEDSLFKPGNYIAYVFIVDGDSEDYLPVEYRLDELLLPASTVTIEEEAFAGSNCQMVTIPASCRTIGKRAFADCEDLVYVKISSSATSIADDAFEGCSDELIIEIEQ